MTLDVIPSWLCMLVTLYIIFVNSYNSDKLKKKRLIEVLMTVLFNCQMLIISDIHFEGLAHISDVP